MVLLAILLGVVSTHAGKKIRFSERAGAGTNLVGQPFEKKKLLVSDVMELKPGDSKDLIIGDRMPGMGGNRARALEEDEDNLDEDGNPVPMTASRAVEKRMDGSENRMGLSKRSREVLQRGENKERDPSGRGSDTEKLFDPLNPEDRGRVDEDIDLDTELESKSQMRKALPVFGGANPMSTSAFPLSDNVEERSRQAVMFDRKAYMQGQNERLEALYRLLNPQAGVANLGGAGSAQSPGATGPAALQFSTPSGPGAQSVQGPNPMMSSGTVNVPGMQSGMGSNVATPGSEARPVSDNGERIMPMFRPGVKIPRRGF